jgi:hypothetical protein
LIKQIQDGLFASINDRFARGTFPFAGDVEDVTFSTASRAATFLVRGGNLGDHPVIVQQELLRLNEQVDRNGLDRPDVNHLIIDFDRTDCQSKQLSLQILL